MTQSLVQYKLDDKVRNGLDKFAKMRYGLSVTQFLKQLSYQAYYYEGSDPIAALGQHEPESQQISNALPSMDNIDLNKLSDDMIKRAKEPSIPLNQWLSQMAKAGLEHIAKENAKPHEKSEKAKKAKVTQA